VFDDLSQQIRRHLGAAIDPDAQGSVRDLNGMPPALLEQARRLPSSVLQLAFLRFHVSADNWQYLPVFLDAVVRGDAPAGTWARGGLLVPSRSLAELLREPVERLLSPLDHRPDELWLRVRPDVATSGVADDLTGAPAVDRPELDYRWTPPGNLNRILGPVSTDHVVDPSVATRRWIASRFALVWPAPRVPEPLDSLVSRLVADATELSDDARAALTGLQIEEQAGLREGVPGFRGPDEWYRGAAAQAPLHWEAGGDPGDAVCGAYERLRRIDWRSGERPLPSQVALVREFLRRSAQSATSLGRTAEWPFANYASALPGARPPPAAILDELHRHLAARRVAGTELQVCDWFLRWVAAEAAGADTRGLSNPLEPLVMLFERGGRILPEKGFIYVGHVGVPAAVRGWQAFAGLPPVVSLDDASLDELDPGNTLGRAD